MKRLFAQYSEAIQLGILGVSVLSVLGSIALWFDARYTHAEAFKYEVNAREELAEEVHAIYNKIIPESERHK